MLSADRSDGRTGDTHTTALLTRNPNGLSITPPVPGFSLAAIGANSQPRVIFDALSELTQTKVISTPRVLVLDNQSARLQVGDVVPIIRQSATSTSPAHRSSSGP